MIDPVQWLNSFLTTKKAKTRNKFQTLKSLVIDWDDNGPPDFETQEKQLAELGTTAEEVAREISKRHWKLKKVAERNQKNQAENEIAEGQRKIEALDRELNDLRQKQEPLRLQALTLTRTGQQRLQLSSSAEIEMLSKAHTPPEIQAEIDEIHALTVEIGKEIEEHSQRVETQRQTTEAVRQEIEACEYVPGEAPLRHRLKGCEEVLERLRKQLDEKIKRREELQEDHDKVREKLLDPNVF